MGQHSDPARARPAVRRAGLACARVAGGAVLLWLLWRRVGTGPFADGLRAVSWQAAAAAAVLALAATVCAAWRWQVVARALGVPVTLPAATGAYYRSQFLNSVLPGGVLGDVHRGVVHGRSAGDVARGVRAVGWERLHGQAVQTVVSVVVLAVLPSPVRPALPWIAAGAAVVTGGAALAVRLARRRGGARLAARGAAMVTSDLRHALAARGVQWRLAAASLAVLAGHTAVFFVAVRASGVTAPAAQLLPLLMVVQTAVVIPLSIGGWGLREGAAAWAFAAAGLGAAAGVTAATLYAILALTAFTPGAALLAADAVRRRARVPGLLPEAGDPGPAPQLQEPVRG